MNNDDYSSEYKLTYKGKTIATLNANYRMEPGEAYVELLKALLGFADAYEDGDDAD